MLYCTVLNLKHLKSIIKYEFYYQNNIMFSLLAQIFNFQFINLLLFKLKLDKLNYYDQRFYHLFILKILF